MAAGQPGQGRPATRTPAIFDLSRRLSLDQEGGSRQPQAAAPLALAWVAVSIRPGVASESACGSTSTVATSESGSGTDPDGGPGEPRHAHSVFRVTVSVVAWAAASVAAAASVEAAAAAEVAASFAASAATHRQSLFLVARDAASSSQ
jgi:hypothetical protein